MAQTEISRSQPQASRRGGGSIRSQVLGAVGGVLLLVLAIIVVGYGNLRGIQARATETLTSATQIRELSLEIENEFLLARQNEANFLSLWRSLGFELAAERYVTANQEHIALAQDKLRELEQVIDAADEDVFGEMRAATEALRPLLADYQRTFLSAVDNIAERSRAGGLEMVLRQQFNALEAISQSAADPLFLELLLRIRANEYAYLDTKHVEYADQVRLLVQQYQDLARESSYLDLGMTLPDHLIAQIQEHLVTFDALVALDRQIENETTIFRDITRDIRGHTDQIVAVGEGGLAQSRAQLEQADRQSLGALVLVGGIALGLGLGGALYVARRISRPIIEMSEVAQQMGEGALEQRVAVPGIVELDALAAAFNAMGGRLQSVIGSLEGQVDSRTQDLERRAAQLRAATEVGRAITTVRNLDDLLAQVTHLISQSFGFYHVGIFLLDDAGEYAVLRAANSSGGQEMLQAGHRLAVGAQGIVGYVTSERRTRIALDVGEDAVHFENPYLPETHSEMALPLLIGERLLGALDVQSRETSAFVPADIEVLEGLADQVAIAIENARLFTEAQAAIAAEKRAYGEVSAEAWQQLLRARAGWGYRYAQQAITSVEGAWRAEMREAAEKQQPVQRGGPEDDVADVPTLAIPIQERGQVVGVLSFRKDNHEAQWTPDEVAVLEDLVQQLGVALESARLYEDTQRRAVREQLTGEITARIRETLDLDSMMQTAAREIRAALGLYDVVVALEPPRADSA